MGRVQNWPAMLRGAARFAYRFAFGRRPHLRIWHPEWLDYRLIATLIDEFGSKRALHVRRAPGLMDEAIPDAERWGFTHAEQLMETFPTLTAAGKDFVLIEIQRGDLPHVRLILEALCPAVAVGGRIAVYLKERSSLEDGDDLADQFVRNVEFIAPLDLSRTEFSFAGGIEKRTAWSALNDWLAVYARRGLSALPFVVWGIWKSLRQARDLNLREKAEQDARYSRTHLSSFLLVVRR